MLSGQFGLSAPFTSYSKRLTDHLANVISDRRRVLQFLQTQYFSPGGRPPLAISSHSQPPWTAWIQAEHFPNRNSFVELNQRRDRFGLRQLDVKIDFGEGDFRNLSRTHNLFAEEAQRRGFAVTTEQSLPPSHFRHLLARKFNSNAHQAGTTRMGTSPRDSVVDKNLRVHGLRNLYTLSGGVFPTFGHANPTLSLVVLGIRLGTKISSEISNPLSPK